MGVTGGDWHRCKGRALMRSVHKNTTSRPRHRHVSVPRSGRLARSGQEATGHHESSTRTPAAAGTDRSCLKYPRTGRVCRCGN